MDPLPLVVDEGTGVTGTDVLTIDDSGAFRLMPNSPALDPILQGG